jgi:hypothetical protein
MAGSISNSWALVKASARVLQLDKELMVFPVLSGVAAILATVTMFAPLWALGGVEILASLEGGYLGYVIAFLVYVVEYSVIFFFNSALVGAALIRMNGGDPTVGDGLRIALSRFSSILGYAVLAATVGMILNFLSERLGFVGKMVVGFIGLGWNLATCMAVPVLVTNNVGPVDAVKESASLFKRTWGEQVVGNFGMGWAFFLMTLSWTLSMVLVGVAVAQLSPVALIPVVIVGILGYLALALVGSTLKGIYTAALYRYATEGETGLFDDRIMASAFRRK